MTSALIAGDQRPRLSSVPPGDVSWDVADLALLAGLDLDDWQRHVLDEGLRRAAGKWSAFEVGLICARQNGKGAILEALELAALFLFPDCRLILHSAHEFKTTSEHFRRVLGLIRSDPVFERRVARVRTQTGAESIELRDGRRLRFVARSGGSGRGFSGDLVVLDEAQRLGNQEMAALLPTLSARPDPQVWYAATAGNPDSLQLGRVRSRGVAGSDPSLAFFEWSVDPLDHDPADPREWARANPGLGIRISADYVQREMAALDPAAFARERLSVGDYPADDGGMWRTISQDAWEACANPGVRV